MRRTSRAGRAFGVAAAVLPFVMLSASPAAAYQPTELALAVAETNIDLGNAVADAASVNAKTPNVTCANPVAHGMAVTPYNDTVVVTVKGTDAGGGEGDCLSRTNPTYTATLTLTVQYRDPVSGWLPTGCEGSGHTTAVEGAAPVVAAFVCPFPATHPGNGRPHRILGVLRNSLVADPYVGYSEPWQG